MSFFGIAVVFFTLMTSGSLKTLNDATKIVKNIVNERMMDFFPVSGQKSKLYFFHE